MCVELSEKARAFLSEKRFAVTESHHLRFFIHILSKP